MVYGAILNKGENGYTLLQKVFNAIGGIQKEYNFLITDCECCPQTQSFEKMLSADYCWLSGDELTSMVESEDFQWIWAVLSGFKKDIPLEKVLEYPLPFAVEHTGFWEKPISIQHPLASIEIVPLDSSATILISDQKDIVDRFRKAFPLSEDLATYNACDIQ